MVHFFPSNVLGVLSIGNVPLLETTLLLGKIKSDNPPSVPCIKSPNPRNVKVLESPELENPTQLYPLRVLPHTVTVWLPWQM